MKISELIIDLTKQLAKKGDLEVWLRGGVDMERDQKVVEVDYDTDAFHIPSKPKFYILAD